MKARALRSRMLPLCVAAGLGCSATPAEPNVQSIARAATFGPQWESWWNTENALSSPRFQHTATLLLDGTVLLIGGADIEAFYQPDATPREVGAGDSALATADVYDPQTDRFEPVGELNEARWGHSATLLRDGRVLVLGGFDASGAALDSAEIYEPDARTFRPFARLKHARGLHTATLLPDERVLVLGGSLAAGVEEAVPELEACLPEKQACVELGSTALLALGHAALLGASGQVDVLSPLLDEGGLPLSAQFEPSTDQLEVHEFPADAIAGPEGFTDADATSALLRVTGEPDGSNQGAPGGQLTGALFLGLRAPSTWAARQGKWMSVGGLEPYYPQGGLATTLLEDYGSILGDRKHGPDLNRGRAWPSATSLSDGSVLVAGGVLRGPLTTAERLPPPLPERELVDGLDEVAGPAHAATLLDDGRLLFTGGWERPRGSHVASFRLKPHVDRAFPNPEVRAVVDSLGGLAAERALHQAIALPGGKVLIAGGKTEPESANEELLDLRTGQTTDLGVRLHHRAAGVYAGGSRFVFAGARGVEVLEGPDFRERSIELPEPPGCDAPNVLRLMNGHVLIAGRYGLFEVDPLRAELVRHTKRPTPRCIASATLLHDGRVFLAAGIDVSGIGEAVDQGDMTLSAVEVLTYDPADGSLEPQPDLPWSIVNATAFTDGFDRVLLANGDLGFSFALVCDVRGQDTRCKDVVDPPPFAARAPSYTRLPFGGVLAASSMEGGVGSLWFRSQAQRLALPDDWSREPLQVTIGAEIELPAHFSKTWPEYSGGSGSGSASNAPIPVWIPTVGGLAVSGTFTRWSVDGATWRVPHTPFPGLGTLFYSVAGVLYPLRMVWISGLESGGACKQGGECATGYCADGVCCDSGCTDACQACSAQVKGHGADGKCEALSEGADDEAACGKDEPSSCRHNGLCDARGQCASYPEGTVCGDDGATCNAEGSCRTESPGRRCNEANQSLRADGSDIVACHEYRCASSTGECLASCTSNVDCSGENVCGDDWKCGPRLDAKSRTSVGCAPGCRVSTGNEDWRAVSGALAVMLGLFWRRARRRRATSPFAP